MYIGLAQLLTATLALSTPLASAVTSGCYPNGGCKTCEDSNVINMSYHGCENGGWKNPPQYFAGKYGHCTINGGFESEKQCHDAWRYVTDCYYKNKKNGAKYTWKNKGKDCWMDVSFCSCK